MKEIKAIIRPARLDEVSEVLRNTPGFPGMTITQVEGCSAPARHQPRNHKEELLDFSSKVRIEIVVDDQYADSLYETIRQVSAIGKVGDGIVWMTPVDRFHYMWEPSAS